MIKIADFEKINMKVGEIKEVKEHPNADKLYVLKVDIGNEERQLVAGIKKWYKKEELIGKKIIVITNLEPAKLRGVESQGMLLAAEDDEDNVVLLTVDKEIKNGAEVR